MTCYHPLIRVEDRSKRIRAKDGHYYYKATVINPENFEIEISNDTPYYKKQLIPCGKCIGCRLDYSREWANRGYLESLEWKQNWFCTVTYNEESIEVPEWVEDPSGITYCNEGEWGGTLVPKDLTQFIKNVRQIMKREYNQDGIRFMACGEYGSETERPHYHIIFFNLNLPVEDLYKPRIINKNVYYQSHIIERAWAYKGICNISEATWNTIAYTARYITKKVNGKISEEYYATKGQKPEFMRVSRMPGIGEHYYRKHWQEIYARDEIIIKNQNGAISCKPPQYFDELYKAEHPEEFKRIQEKRKREGRDIQKIIDMTFSGSRAERLAIAERDKEDQHQKLVRVLESNL